MLLSIADVAREVEPLCQKAAPDAHALPQQEARYHQHMPLKMSVQERKGFLGQARLEDSLIKGKKAKGAMIDAVVPFVGYQSRKQAIRPLPQASGADAPKNSMRRNALNPLP